LYIIDISELISEKTAQKAYTLRTHWSNEWKSISSKLSSNKEITIDIQHLRLHIRKLMRSLK